jgi:hypothetical protein
MHTAGLPVPTQDIVEAIEAIVGLRPPAKMMAVVQKLINCCPEASAVLQEKALNDQSKGGTSFPCLCPFIPHFRENWLQSKSQNWCSMLLKESLERL